MRPRPKVSLREALEDPQLLGHALPGDSWRMWRTVLLAAMGEPLEPLELEAYQQVTGRAEPPAEPVEELVAVVGRRGGKSKAVATLSSYLATLMDYAGVTARGERGLALCIAMDIRQARIIFNYALADLEASPVLSAMIQSRTQNTIRLSNDIDIEVRSASWRRLRGVTAVSVCADESAFWYSDEHAANPDAEILQAVRPALATTGGLLAICSSPYAKKGELWNLYHNHFGPEGDNSIMVAQGKSRLFNPELPERVIARAYERDPVAAAAEYGAEFRNDISSFISRETVAACVEQDCRELLPEPGVRYRAFCDPAGGGPDSFTLAIAHAEKDRIILDLLREARPPYSPPDVAHEFALELQRYRCTEVVGDKYASQWVSETFRKRGILYRPAEKSKSEIFRELLPKLNARGVSLLDNDRLTSQLCALERRVGFSGKDQIGHPPSSHDDVANAAAGAIWVASGAGSVGEYSEGTVQGLV